MSISDDAVEAAAPYEIAERYAAGDFDRDAMISDLSAWPYSKNDGAAAAAVEWESTPYVDTPGSFAEVGRAFDEGLIDGDAYDQILDAGDRMSRARVAVNTQQVIVRCYDCSRDDHDKCKAADGALCKCRCEDCKCGHDRGYHFQDGCLHKTGGVPSCECLDFEPVIDIGERW